MPPQAIAIPVINRSLPGGGKPLEKGKVAKRLAQTSRTYLDGPLPIKPSDHAPKNARITGRNFDDESGVTYQLKIGDVEINDVDIEEILDYVSPLALEEYENREFLQERVVLSMLEAEREMQRREKLERQKERAKRKGVVSFEDVESTEEVTGGEEEVELGKHGRARPTYTHLFMKPEPERRRRKDSQSDNLTSASDREEEGNGEPARPATTFRSSGPVVELQVPKRRRRKRDKDTGVLLPLSPVTQQPTGAEKKRHRRKRHPQTGELMPIGWSYDVEDDDVTRDKERDGLTQQSFRKLSISHEHNAKRQRLDTESSVSRSPSPFPTKAQFAAQRSPVKVESMSGLKGPHKNAIVELLSSDDEHVHHQASAVTPKTMSLKPLPMSATARNGKGHVIESRGTSLSRRSSPRREGRTSLLSPSAEKEKILASSTKQLQKKSPERSQNTKTSIMNPSATRTSSTEPSAHSTDEEFSENDLEDGEWYVEAILNHQESDPATHPPDFGRRPVMLYLVKWEGSDDLTWEPAESFGDPTVVQQYRNRVGLDSASSDDHKEDEIMGDEDTTTIQVASRAPSTSKERSARDPKDNRKGYDRDNGDDNENDDPLGNDVFEVEAILAHHLSDPRTHPPELGRTAVLLYEVKWKGFDQTTWEPASSFEDKTILQQYHERIGRKGISGKLLSGRSV